MKDRILILLLAASGTILAQEANSGFDLSATVSAEAVESHELTESPRDGSPATAGFRSVFYPTLKLDEHWTVSGAIQVESRPYWSDEFTTQGYGVTGRILQANIGYSRVWKNRSIVIRAGEVSSAFGSFLLRYDDAVNPLIGMPMEYGYYYAPVTDLGLAGIQADMTLGKWDGRVQLANSSPLNPRSVFEKDQYGNWAGGVGYTIRQGFRVGLSAYRGPYLDRQSPFFHPGEAPPNVLPATAGGVDVGWAHGHWSVQGEWQRFVMTYHAIPTFRENAGYAEARRVLSPRWYVAVRAGYLHGCYESGGETYEAVAGFRPDTRQLIKFGYTLSRVRASGELYNTWSAELVTTLHPLSMAWN
jgi:hypothetical protein